MFTKSKGKINTQTFLYKAPWWVKNLFFIHKVSYLYVCLQQVSNVVRKLVRLVFTSLFSYWGRGTGGFWGKELWLLMIQPYRKHAYIINYNACAFRNPFYCTFVLLISIPNKCLISYFFIRGILTFSMWRFYFYPEVDNFETWEIMICCCFSADHTTIKV